MILTCNFSLTVKRVLKAVQGMNLWLLVANTDGINVWCASCGGIFTEHRVIEAVKLSGLKDKGVVILNTREAGEIKLSRGFKLAMVDASGIAYKLGLVTAGIPIVNTAVLGAFVKATNLISLESLFKAIKDSWEASMANKNIEAVNSAFNETILRI